MDIAFGAATDIGRVRSNNEDRYWADPATGLFAVVDGVGGQTAGEVASESVTTALYQFIRVTDDDEEKTWPFGMDITLSSAGNRLRVAVLVANQALTDRIAEDESLRGMAATVAALLLRAHRAVVASVGDCRVYLLRQKTLTQVTVDHSWVGEQVQLGVLDAEAARQHPMRNLLTRALSGDDKLAVDIIEFDVQANDALLLCSDGLSSMISDGAIQQCLLETLPNAQEACGRLIRAANDAGGKDNTTVVVVSVQD